MKVIVNKRTIELDMKETTESYIAKYHQLNAQLEDGHRDANERYKRELTEGEYTFDYIQKHYEDKINSLTVVFEDGARKLNSEFKHFISNVKETLTSAFTDNQKPADYAVKIGNALTFLELEGAEITDKIAHEILKDFIDDMETMTQFERVISHLRSEPLFDPYGHTVFPLTFKKLEHYRTFNDTFGELSMIAENFFLNRKTVTDTELLINGARLSVPADGMQQMMDEHNSVRIAETLNEMVRELFITTD